MRKFSLLACAIIFISCATPEEKQRIQELNAEIHEAQKGVKVIPVGASNWCELELGSSCQYLGSQGCLAKAEGKDEACMRRIKTAGVKLGGDHVVITLKEQVLDKPEQTRFNGDVYRCSDTYASLNQSVLAVKPNIRLKAHRWVSREYAEQCNISERCNTITEFKCTTLRKNQTRRCYAYIMKNQYGPEKEHVNTLAYEKESFADDGAEDQIRLRYTLSGTMYQCSFK